MVSVAQAYGSRDTASRSVRLEIEIAAERLQALDQLVEETGARSRKDLVSKALTLLDWATGHIKQGRVIAAVDDREQRLIELSSEFLSSLAGDTVRGAHRHP